jgi:hypothetical protein
MRIRAFTFALLAGAALTIVLEARGSAAHAGALIQRGPAGVALFLAAALVLAAAALAGRRRPALVILPVSFAASVLLVLSGNLFAFVGACGILGIAFLLGDAISEALRGKPPELEDWGSSLAAGAAVFGLTVLILGEAGVLARPGAAGVALAIGMLRWRRAYSIAGQIRERVLSRAGQAPAELLETLWITIGFATLAAKAFKILGPDVGWDALAYHLPEARGIAMHVRVAMAADLFPYSVVWHNHETFLGLGFLLPPGERVVRFLTFGLGLAGVGASVALARRVGKAAPASLVLLLLVGFPVVLRQFQTASTDWATATLVACSAAELAGCRQDPGRARLAAVLLGAAIVTKPYALVAVPALAVLYFRRRGARPGELFALSALAFAPVVLWMAWSFRHLGTPVSPLDASGASVEILPDGGIRRTAERLPPPPPDLLGPGRPHLGFWKLLQLPYDLAFRWDRVGNPREGNLGSGLALLVALGVLGWRRGPISIFLFVTLATLAIWLSLPELSIRYLLPVYPLYSVFAAVGLAQGSDRFSGAPATAAGVSLVLVLLALPTQFAIKNDEVRASLGLLTADQVRAREVPGFELWRLVSKEDRLVLVGVYDRLHCPAELAYRTRFLPVARWGDGAGEWRRELKRYGITAVAFSPAPGPVPVPGCVARLVEEGALVLQATSREVRLYRVQSGGIESGSGGARPPGL